MIDNHLYHGNARRIDPKKIVWKRAMDMNDRALRQIVVGLGDGNGPLREDGFLITPASEIMAILCLSEQMDDLRERLGRIIIGYDQDGQPVTPQGMGRHLFPKKTRAPRCSRMEPGPSGVPHAHGTRVKRAASRPAVSLFDSLGVYRPDKPNASASSRNDFCFASKSCVMVTTINSVVLYRSLICRIRSFTCSLVPTIIRLRFS